MNICVIVDQNKLSQCIDMEQRFNCKILSDCKEAIRYTMAHPTDYIIVHDSLSGCEELFKYANKRGIHTVNLYDGSCDPRSNAEVLVEYTGFDFCQFCKRFIYNIIEEYKNSEEEEEQ